MDNNDFQQQPIQQSEQPTFYQQNQQSFNGPQLEPPMTLGDWIITLLITYIPCINIVMLFVWGFGQGNTSRKNYCRAMLILFAIGIVLSIIFGSAIVALLASSISNQYIPY